MLPAMAAGAVALFARGCNVIRPTGSAAPCRKAAARVDAKAAHVTMWFVHHVKRTPNLHLIHPQEGAVQEGQQGAVLR